MRQRPWGLSVIAVVVALVAAVPAGVTTASPAGAAPPPVPSAPGAFVGLTPARVLDTRGGLGAPKAPVTSGRPVHLVVAGHGGVPTDAAAVVLTLTVVGTHAGGYLTAYPTGTTPPVASVVNWATGQTVAGEATVTLGTGGAVDLQVVAGQPVDLVADVSGYTVAGTATAPGTYTASTPTRLLDTRTGTGAPRGQLTSGHTLHVTLAGHGPVPATGASAVIATLTATGSRTTGYLTAWPGGTRPVVSSVNYAAHQTVANQVTVPLGPDGGIDLYAGGGPLDAVLDVTGYVHAGTATVAGAYVPLAPSRVLDTRSGPTPRPGVAFDVPFTAHGGVPGTDVGAVVTNLTATTTRSSGHLSTWPAGSAGTNGSNLNWATGHTVANQATLTLGTGGRVTFRVTAAAAADVVVDVSGYYLSTTDTVPPGPVSRLHVTATAASTVTLAWSAPTDTDNADAVVRYATGSVAPAGPHDGHAAAGGVAGTTVTGLQSGTTYTFAVFARDTAGNTAPAASVTATTTGPHVGKAVEVPRPDGADPDVPFGIDRLVCPETVSTCVTLEYLGPGVTAKPFIGSLAGGVWTSTPVPLPADASTTSPQLLLRGLACASDDLCVAVGDYQRASGVLAPVVVRVIAGRLDVSTPLAPGVPRSWQEYLLDVSCSRNGSCVGIGNGNDPTGSGRSVFTVDVAADHETLADAQVPTTLDEPSAEGISCADGTCGAIGDTRDAGNLLGHRDGSTWTWIAAPVPKGLHRATVDLPDVDCVSAQFCSAIGWLPPVEEGATSAAASNGSSFEETWNGTAWEAADVDGLPRAAIPARVSCATAGECLQTWGAGPDTYFVVTHGGTTSVQTAPRPSDVSAYALQLTNVVCAAPGRCLVVGSSILDDRSQRGLLVSVVDGVATAVTSPNTSTTPGMTGLQAVSCPTADTCLVAGYRGEHYDAAFVEPVSLR